MTRKPTAPSARVDVEHHHLAELVEFRPDQGIIRLHEQRVVLLSAAAMGLMRKELIDTLGLETARRLFLRFGYADGYHDAVSLRDRSRWSAPLEGLQAGVVLHRLEGIVRAEIRAWNTTPRPAAFTRTWSGTTPTWPNSTCTTTAGPRHRCAGR